MKINQFTVNKRLIGMYFKYPWGSLGLKDMPHFIYLQILSLLKSCKINLRSLPMIREEIPKGLFFIVPLELGFCRRTTPFSPL